MDTPETLAERWADRERGRRKKAPHGVPGWVAPGPVAVRDMSCLASRRLAESREPGGGRDRRRGRVVTGRGAAGSTLGWALGSVGAPPPLPLPRRRPDGTLMGEVEIYGELRRQGYEPRDAHRQAMVRAEETLRSATLVEDSTTRARRH